MIILTIASVVTAITVIVTAVYKTFKMYTTLQNNYVKTMKQLDETTLLTLRLAIYNDKLDIEERLQLGEKYLSLDNDDIAIQRLCKRLAKEYEEQMFHD